MVKGTRDVLEVVFNGMHFRRYGPAAYPDFLILEKSNESP